MKSTKHNYTLSFAGGKTDQYISVNNILGIKFCFAVEPTSEGSVRLWSL